MGWSLRALSDGPNGLAEALDGLTNNENRLSSFYMRALFWVFPSILKIGKKGNMIRQTKRELGEISSQLLADTRAADDPASNTLLAMMPTVRSPTGPDMTEEYVVAQMRTIISAAYETVSAVIAVRIVTRSCGSLTNISISSSGCFPLLDAILLETLRLHPAILENHHVVSMFAPVLFLTLTQCPLPQAAETISVSLSEPLPGADVPQLVIPKGTIISIPVNVLHTDKRTWGPDANIFRPERWSELHRKKHRCEENSSPSAKGKFIFIRHSALTLMQSVARAVALARLLPWLKSRYVLLTNFPRVLADEGRRL
ncbi:cytochrome P450 [Salix suchowensis]|nr:cytochrome P450 [Salix suchowensis]